MKKYRAIEDIVTACVLIGGGTVLGAGFSAAADALGTLAKYALNNADHWEFAEHTFAYIVGGVLSGAFTAYSVFRKEHIESRPSFENKPLELTGHSSGSFSSDNDPGDDLMMSPFSATGSKYISTREYSGR